MLPVAAPDMRHPTDKRVLAIDATSRGFGFAVLEGPDELADWGVKESKPYCADKTIRRAAGLIEQYRPAVVVLEDHGNRRRPRSARVSNIIAQVTELATAAGVSLAPVAWSRVRQAVTPNGGVNKYGIARRVAERLPVLASQPPRYRKPWMSEDYRMAIFDAAALGLAYYALQPRYRGLLRKGPTKPEPSG